MSDIQTLRRVHGRARIEFEEACASDISKEDFEAIRERYHATMKAYHDALGLITGSVSAAKVTGE